MKLIPIMQCPGTGKQYILSPTTLTSSCEGCAFDEETDLCLSAGNDCSDKDLIWTEILKVEKVD